MNEYSVRLQRAAFFNVFRHTITGLAGFVFRIPPTLDEDVPVVIAGKESEDEGTETEGIWENIDNAGTHGDVFARDLLVDAMIAGHAAILVEYPQTGGAQWWSAPARWWSTAAARTPCPVCRRPRTRRR
jgi:hypothetical protein